MRRFISLRTKLIVFVSLIIVSVCSGLGWYFIQQRVAMMHRSLIDTGTILAKNLAYNSRHLLFIEDLEGLGKLIDGVMEVEDVVYVVITGPEGKRLAAKSKGNLYPDPAFVKRLLESSSSEPVITPFTVRGKDVREEHVTGGKAETIFVPTDGEALEDFAVPIFRRSLPEPLIPQLALESPMPQPSGRAYGVVQIGMTWAKMLATLNALIVKAALMTVLIILAGIAATVLLAGRIITPLKSLAGVAGRIAEGDLTVSVRPVTSDEVGQLAAVFDDMTKSLKERDLAIAKAYQQLEQLAQSLELRVQQRTQELQEANLRLQELDKLKSDFVSTVSHELRTPMTSIKGYVDNILDGLTGALTERQSYYLTRVKSNVERLTRMINELLDLSRIEAGKIELHLANVRMRELVSDVVEGFQAMAQGKGIVLHTRMPSDLPAIRGDHDKLHQVLTNLVQNAIKFTPTGGEVWVESQVRDDGFLQIGVVDTGYGIPPHELDKVFERFYRGTSRSPDDPRWGLGLTIARSLVKLHGGQIWVESTPGQGSRFYFTVPIEQPSR
ncbi:MAG TPA: ATP-binding protein [Nitrospiraceae bacterium]|jgi:signal transduction histidine kinase|nr:ATP-binding protein [Nitrospiraceae bacterium]